MSSSSSKKQKIRKNHKKTLKKRVNGIKKKQKNGWIKMKIYGTPLERGFAHGFLLQKELQKIREEILPFLVKNSFPNISYEKYEKDCRENITDNIREKFPEYYIELQGIEAGANHSEESNKKVNMDFLIAWNSFLSMASFYNKHSAVDHCSAFIAIGDATEKGDIIMAHTTHSDFVSAKTLNIVLEIIPEKGNKIKMQTSPGLICSSSDWFICGNGIIGCETTIGSINYKPKFGIPYFCRIREAMQYGNTLDDYVKIMMNENAGDYAGSWLLGDTRNSTKEIMLLELGLHTKNIQRKTNGIFYGMNSAISPEIREKETTDKTHWDMHETSGARNIRLHVLLYEMYYSKLNIHNAKAIISDHYDVSQTKETDGNTLTICKHTNLDNRDTKLRKAYYPFGCTDGKVINSEMAKKMIFVGRMGPACGTPFYAKRFLEKHSEYKSWEKVLPNMLSEPWIKL
jgi:hypothetical protein